MNTHKSVGRVASIADSLLPEFKSIDFVSIRRCEPLHPFAGHLQMVCGFGEMRTAQVLDSFKCSKVGAGDIISSAMGHADEALGKADPGPALVDLKRK